MNKTKWLGVLVVAAALLWVPQMLLAARASRRGPAPAPMANPFPRLPLLHINAFNDKHGERCITCDVAFQPAVFAFVRQSDAATKKLMSAVDDTYRKLRDQRLGGCIVIVGEGEAVNALRSYALKHKFEIPTAQLATTTPELIDWELDPKAASTVVFLAEHSVKHHDVDLTPELLAERVKEIIHMG